MRLWYLSHRWPAKAQVSLRIHAVSPEPSLVAHMKYGSGRRVRPNIRHLASVDDCTCAIEERIYEGGKGSWAGSNLFYKYFHWSNDNNSFPKGNYSLESSQRSHWPPPHLNEPQHNKVSLRKFLTRPDTNWPAQLQKLARVLKFRL